MPDQTTSLADRHLQIVADASHPDRHPEGQIRDMAAELLTARAVIKNVLALTRQEDDDHSEFGHGHEESSELECPACWADEIRDAVQPYIDYREAFRDASSVTELDLLRAQDGDR